MILTLTPVDILHKKAQRNRFIELSWKLHSRDPHWVPPFKMSLNELFNPKHPFYQQGSLVAWIVSDEQGQDLGRIAAVINRAYNQFHQDRTGFFGFFEAVNDQAVANLLFETAFAYLKEQGLESMVGPMNPSTNYECGLLVNGYDDPAQIMMTYNPPYYEGLYENWGLKKAQDLLAYQMPTNIEMPEVIARIFERTQKSHKITWRPVNLKNWKQEIDTFLEIYNDAWEQNWGFVPMSNAEFQHTAKDLKSLINPNYILVAEVNQEPAAFIVSLPDYNQVFKQIPNGSLFPTGLYKLLTAKKRINRARVITLGIKKKFRNLGLDTLLYIKAQESMLKEKHIKEVEMSWILEDNLAMNKPLIRMKAHPYKRYRVYQKQIQGTVNP